MKRMLLVVLALGILLFNVSAEGQQEAQTSDFPKKPITIICPWAAGGGTDRTARFIAEELSEILGVPVQVNNLTGGAGAVGHNAVVNATPDGYTIGNITFEANTLKYLGYSELTPSDFLPILQFNSDAAAITVCADSPYNNITELLDAIKSGPEGQFIFSGSGIGTVWDLSRIALLHLYGIDPNKVKYVPSKGAAPAVTELLGNHVDVITCSYPEVSAQVEAGKLKVLGILADERNPQFSDIPTVKEQGIDFSYGTWRGFALPPGTPQEVVDILVDALTQIVESEKFNSFMADAGFGVQIRIDHEFRTFMIEQFMDLEEVFKLSGYNKQ